MTTRRDDLVRAAGDGRSRCAERLGRVEREIRQAQAEALGRVGERLQGLLDRVVAIDGEIDAILARGVGAEGAAPPALHERLEVRNRARDEAARVRHHLVVQREALGLPRHAAVEQCYPVPGRRRLPGTGQAEGRGR